MIYFHVIWIKTMIDMFCVDLDGFMLVYVLMWWMYVLYEIFPWNIFFQFLKIFYLDSLWKIKQFCFLRNSIPIKIEKVMNFWILDAMAVEWVHRVHQALGRARHARAHHPAADRGFSVRHPAGTEISRQFPPIRARMKAACSLLHAQFWAVSQKLRFLGFFPKNPIF